MNEDSAGNLKQIISSFHLFVNLHNNKQFPKDATIEDIKKGFKLAHSIETVMLKFKHKNQLDKLMQIINLQEPCNNTFFELACDNFLALFFQYPDLSEKTLDIAVRIYTSLLPQERFQNAISTLILKQTSLETLIDLGKSCNLECEKYCIFLNSLKKMEPSSLNLEIERLLSISKVEDSLYLLIGVLSLTKLEKREREIYDLILKQVLHKMIDRSILSKSFWITLFKNLDLTVLCKCCANAPEFLNSLLNFIIYLGCTMDKNSEGVWMANEQTAYCPEITFLDILRLFKQLCQTSEKIKDYVMSRLLEAKDNTESVMWDDIRLIVQAL